MRNKTRQFIKTLVCILYVGLSINAYSENKNHTIQGVVYEKKSNDVLIGVSIIIEGTTTGTNTDIDGRYKLENVPQGSRLNVVYISYKTIRTEKLELTKDISTLDFYMEDDLQILNEAVVLARQNMESDQFLRNKRINSNVAVESIGAKEMSLKGISSAEDGVRKISGVSFDNSGQVFVRGLGDRYSITTLNGLPIASPNPDNKLIPLDIFPATTIQNIEINKVYQASSFADYSGALIDINTKSNLSEESLNISFSTGGTFGSTFKDFYKSDSKGLFLTNKLDKNIPKMSPTEFSNYIKDNDPFGTTFNISKTIAIPDFKLQVAYGRGWKIKNQNIDFFLSISADKSTDSQKDNYVCNLSAQGNKLNEFYYDSFDNKLQITGLGNISYAINHKNKIIYNLFYARNAQDNYKKREGYDSEGINLIGSNSVMHIYSLLNNQLMGEHNFGENWILNWSSSYGITSSDEPDRRQVMFKKTNNELKLFKLNKQETMRYFGSLNENEIVGAINLKYAFRENKSFIEIGTAYKEKNRDYNSTRFYYNLSGIDPIVEDIYNTDDYLNQENIENGKINIIMDAQPKSNYFANSRVIGAYANMDYNIGKLMINAGIRYEYSDQSVKYWTDASIEKHSKILSHDFFPTINLKYNFSKTNIMRLSLSRTVTRPSFIEMAPFLYKESYGSAEIRGNENIQNGYNYNIDLRYELFAENSSDMLSVTAYYKHLLSPIERVQETSGGSVIHSFRNTKNGMATGIELELRKNITKSFAFNFNASYIYTTVVLPEGGGIYTDSKRALQGASPYLINADISYQPKLKKDSYIRMSLVYNLQGPRIHAVGIYGMNNVIQKDFHTLNYNLNYAIDKNWNVGVQLKNILNSDIKFTQKMDNSEEKIEVERIRNGISMSIGCNYKF